MRGSPGTKSSASREFETFYYAFGGRGASPVAGTAAFAVPLHELRAVTLPSWRDIPQRAPDYWNFARPGEPNVVLELAQTITVTMIFGLRRSASRLGVRVAEPEKFHDAIANILHRTADSHT